MTPILLQPDGVPITAQQERQGSAALYGGGANRPLGGRSGFRVDTPSDVFTATASAWTLKPCSIMIDPGASTHQGMYGWATDANITQASIPGTPVAPDATYPRKDIYFIRVNDSSAGDGSGLKSAPVEYLAGTPNAAPVAPALPARSFLIATVTVPQTGGGSPTVLLNPARFVAAGGTLPVFSQSEQDALVPFDGFRVQRIDLAGKPTYTHNGTTYITPIENIAFTPEAGYSFTGSLTKVTGTTGSTAQLVGKITRNSGGDGPLLGTTWARVMTTFLPASVVPAAGFPADCVANLSTGVMGDGNPNIVAHVNISLRSDRNLWARLDAGSYTWPLNGYLYVNVAWPL